MLRSPRVLSQLLVAVLVAFVVTAPWAAAASKPRRIALARGAVAVTDGQRYAAYSAQPGIVTIIDTQTGLSKDHPADSGCAPADAAAGQLLLRCEPTPSSQYPGVMSLHSGAVAYPAGSRPSEIYDNIGRYWLRGADPLAHGGPVLVYLNSRTGERRAGAAAGAGQRDLDTPDLAPLRPCGRTPRSFVQYRSPFVLGFSKQPALVLTRCRPPKRTTIASCQISCDTPQLSRAWVTWATLNRAYAYSIRTGRRLTWRFSDFDQTLGYSMTVAHTHNRLFVTVARRAQGSNAVVDAVYETALKQ
jgi:hypothetical protein